jgi:hypothetical protein
LGKRNMILREVGALSTSQFGAKLVGCLVELAEKSSDPDVQIEVAKTLLPYFMIKPKASERVSPFEPMVGGHDRPRVVVLQGQQELFLPVKDLPRYAEGDDE